ncbi:MAG: hypothetical protein R6U01_07615 [Halorubrum sp.]|uniref:DUF7504 family protein n=1 Tax=Halorubrum sp. TaxID=1879286 RepID=UPI0039709D11
MSVHAPELIAVACEYLHRPTDPTAEATGGDRRPRVDPSVYVDGRGNELVDRLLAAERYPGDLTSLGVAVERTTTEVVTSERTGTFAIATMTQLLAHHDSSALDRFLHELVGRWRNRGVGGLVHVSPASDIDGSGCVGSAHFDYVVQVRAGRDGIEARTVGKRDVPPTWRKLGSAPRSESAQSRRASDRRPPETVEKEGDGSVSDRAS